MLNGEKTAFPTGAENPNYEGLTKREYFAAMAMQGMVTTTDPYTVAKYAVEQADALLAELEKPQQ